jgi:cohesin complex subunit SCC1
MKAQSKGAGLNKLACKRRKLPQTVLDMWKFSRTGRNDTNLLLEPLLQGKLVCSWISKVYSVFTSKIMP